ncbi:MAG: hypothetical protein Q7T50_08400 [Candidatus Magasanikbacteria bacterium]|nr:hypothetical protein [Candidatus Magasanikbacteria bacterium]
MKKILLLLALLVGMHSHAFGFATVANAIKGGDEIVFNSNSQDVDVYLNGSMVGKVSNQAFTYKVKRDGKAKVFLFKKAGYKDVSVTLTTTFDNMFWGNLIIGGSLGSSTDSWFTNSSQEYSPNQFFVQMEKA